MFHSFSFENRTRILKILLHKIKRVVGFRLVRRAFTLPVDNIYFSVTISVTLPNKTKQYTETKKVSTEDTTQTSCGHIIYYRKIPVHFLYKIVLSSIYNFYLTLLHDATFRIVFPIQAYYKMQEKEATFDLRVRVISNKF